MFLNYRRFEKWRFASTARFGIVEQLDERIDIWTSYRPPGTRWPGGRTDRWMDGQMVVQAAERTGGWAFSRAERWTGKHSHGQAVGHVDAVRTAAGGWSRQTGKWLVRWSSSRMTRWTDSRSCSLAVGRTIFLSTCSVCALDMPI